MKIYTLTAALLPLKCRTKTPWKFERQATKAESLILIFPSQCMYLTHISNDLDAAISTLAATQKKQKRGLSLAAEAEGPTLADHHQYHLPSTRHPRAPFPPVS